MWMVLGEGWKIHGRDVNGALIFLRFELREWVLDIHFSSFLTQFPLQRGFLVPFKDICIVYLLLTTYSMNSDVFKYYVFW